MIIEVVEATMNTVSVDSPFLLISLYYIESEMSIQEGNMDVPEAHLSQSC